MPLYNLEYSAEKWVEKHKKPDNYGLAIDKAGRWNNKDKRLDYQNENNNKLFHRFFSNKELLASLCTKQNSYLTNQKLLQSKCITIQVKQTWRFATGLGNVSAYNNGFSLHKLYGIPYLKGQSIKGTLRSAILEELYTEENLTNDAEKKAMLDPMYCYLFGADEERSYDKKAHKGNVIFMDAYPSGSVEIAPDIMNPHYPDYYKQDSGSKNLIAPGDWQSPVPIVFLSVKNATYNLRFICSEEKEEDSITPKLISEKDYSIHPKLKGKSVLTILKEYIPIALEWYGIGGKTSVGYGRMKIK